jgi:predicted dehydrogenase
MPKKYRIGVIGHTRQGAYGHHLDEAWLKLPNCEIVGVADADEPGLAAAVKRLGEPKGFSDYRKMIEETQPDVVAVCPRWIHEHRDMILAAAERGIHVYMEKPFCRTPAEADEIIDVCERTHAKLGIAFVSRYSPVLPTVKRLLEEGTIGEVLEFRARGKEDRRGGGEDLWVLGTHVLNLIHHLGGEPKWCFADAMQDGRRVTKEDVREGPEGIGPLAANQVHAIYGLPGGKAGYFSSHHDVQGDPSRYAIQIFGSKGILEVRPGSMLEVKYLDDSSWSPGRSGKEWRNVSSAGIGEPEPLSDPEYADYNLNGVKDFIASLEEDRLPKANMYEARWTVEMISAVFDSHRVNAPVTFPLENRENALGML